MGDYNVNSLIELKSSTTQMQEFYNIFFLHFTTINYLTYTQECENRHLF